MADLRVQVCYATPACQHVRECLVPPGTSLRQAIELSGLLAELPEVDLERGRFGIYGKLKPPEYQVRDNDRIEIYRPLVADPKDARRRRAGRASKSATAL